MQKLTLAEFTKRLENAAAQKGEAGIGQAGDQRGGEADAPKSWRIGPPK